MISTDITGSAKDNLTELLSIVTDPKAYSEKMSALQAKIAENKKYVELVAPASDIIKLRNDTRDLVEKVRQEAEDIKTAATAEAKHITDEATVQAKETLAQAKTEASEIKANALEMQEKAKAELVRVSNELAAVEKLKQELQSSISKHSSLNLELEAALAKARESEQAAETLRQSIIEKQRAFIASI